MIYRSKLVSAVILIVISSMVTAGCALKRSAPTVGEVLKDIEKATATSNAQGFDPAYLRDVSNLKLKIKKNPNDKDTMVELGNLYLDNFEYPKAIETYTRAIKLDDKNPVLVTNLGSAYYRMGQLETAISYFKQATKIEPNHAQAWYNLGVVYHKQEARAETIEAWEKYLLIEKDSKDTEQIEPIKLEVSRLKRGEPFNKGEEEQSSSDESVTPMPSSSIDPNQ